MNDWDDIFTIVGTFICIVMLIAWPFLEVMHYKDCKKVGHTTGYCVYDIFR